MTTVVAIDGAIGPAETAAVSVLDRGFALGDGVFEALRTYGGVPFALDRHLARLGRGAEALGIALPVPLTALGDEVMAALASGGNDESVVRIVVTRGPGPMGLDPSSAGPPTRVILVAPLRAPSAELVRHGLSVALVEGTSPGALGSVAGVKPLGYLASLVALREAHARGADDAVLVGPCGELLEGATSSLFAVVGGTLLTPPVALGILPGVTREAVMAAAIAAAIPVREALLFPRDLYDADEAFLTSSVRELAPIVRVDGRPLGAGTPGPVGRAVAAAYRRHVAAATARR